MVIVIADYQVQAGDGDRVADILARHVSATRGESGCLQFVACRDTEDRDHFALFEAYESEAAFAAHRETPHYATNIESGVAPMLARRRWRRFDEVEPNPGDE